MMRDAVFDHQPAMPGLRSDDQPLAAWHTTRLRMAGSPIADQAQRSSMSQLRRIIGRRRHAARSPPSCPVRRGPKPYSD